MSYSRRQVIVATAGFAAFAATSANAENSNVQRRSSPFTNEELVGEALASARDK